MAYTTIDDPSAYFDVTIWTGSGGARTITGLNHKPDLIWTKTRSVAYNHMLSDSSRGFNANSEIGSNSEAAEGGLSADVYGYKSGHTSDGWTMVDGTDSVDSQEDGNTNQPSVTYVGWTWAANGGTTSSFTESGNNPGGTIQTNTDAGFSIITTTGTGGAGTISHGLGAVPHWIISKCRSHDNTGWGVYHKQNTSAPETELLGLAGNGATLDSSSYYNDTAPTSSVFTVGTSNDINGDARTYVFYAWTEIQGFSKFGSYTGNGNADGPFVYTGFKPAWVMIKNTSASANWHMYDNKRDATNVVETAFKANNSGAEFTTSNKLDFVSNGFKNRAGDQVSTNTSGSTYIYMAFAEHPFVSSKGVPTTAR